MGTGDDSQVGSAAGMQRVLTRLLEHAGEATIDDGRGFVLPTFAAALCKELKADTLGPGFLFPSLAAARETVRSSPEASGAGAGAHSPSRELCSFSTCVVPSDWLGTKVKKKGG